MSKIHLCEFCGKIGASKVNVIGTEYTGDFYLCEHCSENVGKYSIEGKTRGEFVNEVNKIPMLSMHGPKSSAFSRERSNWELINVCDNCSRKTSEGVSLGDNIVVTPLIKRALPPKLRNGTNAHLCPLCMEELQIKMVSLIPMVKLPLQINTKEFIGEDGEEWEYLNEELKGFISKRLQGVPLVEVNSLASPKVKKCLDISLEYLTDGDRLLFKKDVKTENISNSDRGFYDPTIANPLIIAEYEHGYLIELGIDFTLSMADFHEHMKKFGYSKKFRQIIARVMELKYDYIRFDTLGPKYQEYEV